MLGGRVPRTVRAHTLVYCARCLWMCKCVYVQTCEHVCVCVVSVSTWVYCAWVYVRVRVRAYMCDSVCVCCTHARRCVGLCEHLFVFRSLSRMWVFAHLGCSQHVTNGT